MRSLLKCLVLLIAVTGFAGVTTAAPVEFNTDRTGGDYTHVTLPTGSVYLHCQALCMADGQCKAWTFVKAGVQGANPRCWLKNTVPAAHANNCCTSGTKAAAPAPVEFNTDRTGGDYTSVTLPGGSTYQQCRDLCTADAPCKAWTYVKAGVQAANPRCWLKNTVPAPHPDNCCTSGVK